MNQRSLAIISEGEGRKIEKLYLTCNDYFAFGIPIVVREMEITFVIVESVKSLFLAMASKISTRVSLANARTSVVART